MFISQLFVNIAGSATLDKIHLLLYLKLSYLILKSAMIGPARNFYKIIEP